MPFMVGEQQNVNIKLKLELCQSTNVIHPHPTCSWVTLNALPSLSKINFSSNISCKCGTQS